MLPNWVQSQHTAFIRWCNMYLTAQGQAPISNAATDFQNGVSLCYLVEAVTKGKVGKIHRAPKHMESYENVQLALDYIKSEGIHLDMVGAADVVDGNLKLILGIIWQLILRYTIDDISQDGVSARDGLLLWCRRKTILYDEDVHDFSKSWKNGLALCAIMDHYRPDLIDYEEAPKSDPIKCVKLALEAAQQAGIPHLIDAEDIVNGADEKSLITYIACWYHAFSALDRMETAGRRIGKFCTIWSTALRMKAEYEKRVKKLLAQIDEQQNLWEEQSDGSLEQVNTQMQALKKYKLERKRQWTTEKAEILQLYGNIRIKLGTYGFSQYEPVPELSPQFLNMSWLNLLEIEKQHSDLLTKHLQQIKHKLCLDFAAEADIIAQSLHSLTVQLSVLGGDLDEQLSEISIQSDALAPLKLKLEKLSELDGKCKMIGIEENHATVYTVDELKYELQLATNTVASKLAFVENQLVARTMGSNVTPALLDEFESVFRHFDHSAKNKLQQDEFAAAIASLGIVYNEEGKVKAQFESIKDETDHVTFHNFIVFMVSVSKDQNSIDQVRESFKEISDNKPFVTLEDLEEALVPEDVIVTLTREMPAKDAGFDYEQYLAGIE